MTIIATNTKFYLLVTVQAIDAECFDTEGYNNPVMLSCFLRSLSTDERFPFR